MEDNCSRPDFCFRLGKFAAQRLLLFFSCGGFWPALLLLTAILWWPLKEIEYNFVC